MQYNFNVPVTPHLGQNVFKTNGGYLLAGYTSNTVTGVDKGIGIIATDNDGNVVWQKQTASAQGYQYSNNTANQAFIQLQNKDLLFTGQHELGIDYSKACMARVSHLTGDTLWTRMYSQPGDSTYLLCSTELSDSSIISFGFRYYLNTVANVNYTKPFMLKVDKYGNYKWHKYINGIWTNSIFFMYQKVIRLNDNDFVVVGTRQNPYS
ncbi:MAG: hypothetical protein QM534_11575, partial [Sediminibacterium sp.]|nr:hypothetical protein [Sediminibacterium sp.]